MIATNVRSRSVSLSLVIPSRVQIPRKEAGMVRRFVLSYCAMLKICAEYGGKQKVTYRAETKLSKSQSQISPWRRLRDKCNQS